MDISDDSVVLSGEELDIPAIEPIESPSRAHHHHSNSFFHPMDSNTAYSTLPLQNEVNIQTAVIVSNRNMTELDNQTLVIATTNESEKNAEDINITETNSMSHSYVSQNESKSIELSRQSSVLLASDSIPIGTKDEEMMTTNDVLSGIIQPTTIPPSSNTLKQDSNSIDSVFRSKLLSRQGDLMWNDITGLGFLSNENSDYYHYSTSSVPEYRASAFPMLHYDRSSNPSSEPSIYLSNTISTSSHAHRTNKGIEKKSHIHNVDMSNILDDSSFKLPTIIGPRNKKRTSVTIPSPRILGIRNSVILPVSDMIMIHPQSQPQSQQSYHSRRSTRQSSESPIVQSIVQPTIQPIGQTIAKLSDTVNQENTFHYQQNRRVGFKGNKLSKSIDSNLSYVYNSNNFQLQKNIDKNTLVENNVTNNNIETINNNTNNINNKPIVIIPSPRIRHMTSYIASDSVYSDNESNLVQSSSHADLSNTIPSNTVFSNSLVSDPNLSIPPIISDPIQSIPSETIPTTNTPVESVPVSVPVAPIGLPAMKIVDSISKRIEHDKNNSSDRNNTGHVSLYNDFGYPNPSYPMHTLEVISSPTPSNGNKVAYKLSDENINDSTDKGKGFHRIEYVKQPKVTLLDKLKQMKAIYDVQNQNDIRNHNHSKEPYLKSFENSLSDSIASVESYPEHDLNSQIESDISRLIGSLHVLTDTYRVQSAPTTSINSSVSPNRKPMKRNSVLANSIIIRDGVNESVGEWEGEKGGESEDNYKYRNRIYGWKLTSVARRRDLVAMFDTICNPMDGSNSRSRTIQSPNLYSRKTVQSLIEEGIVPSDYRNNHNGESGSNVQNQEEHQAVEHNSRPNTTLSIRQRRSWENNVVRHRSAQSRRLKIEKLVSRLTENAKERIDSEDSRTISESYDWAKNLDAADRMDILETARHMRPLTTEDINRTLQRTTHAKPPPMKPPYPKDLDISSKDTDANDNDKESVATADKYVSVPEEVMEELRDKHIKWYGVERFDL